MPTNLPPEYFEAEERYREAESVNEKITTLENLLGAIPKHKGTDKLRAGYRRRLSKLKSASQAKKGVSRQRSPYHIDKEGAGQVVVVGPANVGKSTLVRTLTNAAPEISESPHTTWSPTPGMMQVENVQIQLIDTPSMDRDYEEPELMDLVRRSDLILLVVDLQAYPTQQIEDTVDFLRKHKIAPARIKDHDFDQRRITFKPMLVIVNKYDALSSGEDFEVLCELLEEEWPLLPVSASTGRNLEKLGELVFDRLEIIRVYSKPPGKEPDREAPFVINKGSTLGEFAGEVHQDFIEKLKTARIWGEDVYDGQLVGKDHILKDGDVVELRL